MTRRPPSRRTRAADARPPRSPRRAPAGERPQLPLALAPRALPRRPGGRGRHRRRRGGRPQHRAAARGAAAPDVVRLRRRRHRGLRARQRHRHLQRRGGPHQRHPRRGARGARRRRCSPPRTATSTSTAASTPSASAGRSTTTSAAAACSQGGSTITQQYVKNVYLTSERSITRKVKEAVLAVKLERELEQGRDPRALPQHDLLRPGRLRRGRRRPGLLRQGRARHRPAGGLLPGRADPLAGRRPTPSPTREEATRRRAHRAHGHGRGGLHRRRRAGRVEATPIADQRDRAERPHRASAR